MHHWCPNVPTMEQEMKSDRNKTFQRKKMKINTGSKITKFCISMKNHCIFMKTISNIDFDFPSNIELWVRRSKIKFRHDIHICERFTI